MSTRIAEYLRGPARGSNGAHVVGVLYLFGALLGVVSLVLPHPASGELQIWGVVIAAAVVGSFLLATGKRISEPMLQASVAFGALLINVMALASDVAAGVYVGMFCWVVLVSVNFFSLRSAILQFVWMMGTFAVVLLFVESSGGYSALTRWLTTMLALAVTGGAGAWLVFRRRLAEEESHRFLDLSQEMLCTIAVDNHFDKLNPAWERILGHPITELYATPVTELIHPEDRPATERALDRLRSGTESLMLENRCRTGDGGWRTMLWTASFHDDETMIYARVRPMRASRPSPLSAEVMKARADLLSSSGLGRGARPRLDERPGWMLRTPHPARVIWNCVRGASLRSVQFRGLATDRELRAWT